MSDYTVSKKVEVLDDVKRIGNVSKVASKHGIARQTIYNWQDKEEELRKEVAKDDALLDLKEKSLIERDVLEGVKKYGQLLGKVGDLEQRKKFLAHKTEHLVFGLVDLIENNPELQEMSPDRQAKVLAQVNDIRKDALGEPDVVVEYRNSWMDLVLQVLRDFLSDQEVREFAQRMEEIESAEYEVLD